MAVFHKEYENKDMAVFCSWHGDLWIKITEFKDEREDELVIFDYESDGAIVAEVKLPKRKKKEVK